jgi:hypothetical protein
MDDVNRWDFDLRDGLRIVDNGDWVRHDDHEYAMGKAAAALTEAQATIARLEGQVGDWIVRADEANARADRMEAALRGRGITISARSPSPHPPPIRHDPARLHRQAAVMALSSFATHASTAVIASGGIEGRLIP